jgi:hypothetical protein
MSEQDKNFYIKFGLILAAYFIVAKPILNTLGITKGKKEREETVADEEAAKAAADALKEKEAALKKKGVKLSKSVADWDIIANAIYQDLARYSGIDDNEADAGYQIARVQNDLDVMQLIKSYGKRDDLVFGLPILGKKDLATTLKDNMSAAKIQAVNGNYARKGIKFRW